MEQDILPTTDALRAVVFDLDGLMFNTEELYEEVGGELLSRRGKQCTRELLDQMMGRPSRIALQIMIDFHQLDASVEQLQTDTPRTNARTDAAVKGIGAK